MQFNKTTKAHIVLCAGAGIQLITGILYTWSVISKALITQYGWTGTQASIPYMLTTIMTAVAMIFGGRFQDEKGSRLTISIGVVLMILGFFTSAFAKTPTLMAITLSLLFGTGLGLSGSGILPSVVKWFSPSKKGLITGILVSGVSIAPILYAPVINWLIKDNVVGITGSFICLSIWILIVGGPLSQLIKSAPEDYITVDDKIIRKQGAPNNAHELTWKEMLNKKDFYLLWVMFIISSSVGLMLTSHIVNIAKYQAGWESGYLSVVVLAVFNTSGRLLGGSLSDRLGRITMIRIIFLIQLINMMFFGLLKSPITVTLGVSICGLCYGAGLAIFPAATADKFGIKNLGVNNGIMFAAWGIGGVVGPLVAGSLFDAFGVYNAAYYIAAMLLAAGLLFSLVYKKINVKTIAIEDNVDV